MLLSYWDGGYVQIDVTDPLNISLLADSTFADPDSEAAESGLTVRPEGNAHQAEFTLDDRYVLAADEDFSPTVEDFERHRWHRDQRRPGQWCVHVYREGRRGHRRRWLRRDARFQPHRHRRLRRRPWHGCRRGHPDLRSRASRSGLRHLRPALQQHWLPRRCRPGAAPGATGHGRRHADLLVRLPVVQVHVSPAVE